MPNEKEKLPPIGRLLFNKGDLIIKEGDYGISIYKILRGKVSIFRESRGKEIPLSTIGAGEVIGEMTFLNKSIEPRSASARVLEETEVEVWHPARLSKEYEEMPAILKYVANQLIRRVIRMNKIIGNLTAKLGKESEDHPQAETAASQRLYYRKELNHPCTYRPFDASPNVSLAGQIKDISFTGVGLEVSKINEMDYPHDKGSVFLVSTVLPNGKEIEFVSEVVYTSKDSNTGKIFMGMEITDLGHEARKTLGFFLMP